MRGPGLFTMLEIAAGMSIAGPLYIVGLEFVRSGRVLVGVGFFALGLFAMFFPSFLLGRIPGPRTWLRRRLGRAGGDSDSSSESGSNSSPLDRLRDR